MMNRLLIAALAAVFPVVLSAQSGNYFGVRLSFDVTHLAGSNDGINNGSGFTLLGIYNIGIGSHVYFEPGAGVFYNTMGIRPVEVDGAVYDGSVRNFGVRVPLNVGYRFEMFDNFELAGYTGPWINLNCTTKARLQPDFEGPAPTGSTNLFDYGWNCFDAQWGFGLTATYNRQYYLAVSGAIGISPMATFTTPESKDRIRRNTVSIAVGYNF